ncbi:MAG: acyltransferase [Prevotella sp.]|nr:acyltransferase [Prevotella sp.]
MTSWIVRIYEAMRRHRVLALLSAVLLTAVLALSLARQTYKEDISDFLPLTDKYSKALRVYQDIAGADRIIVLFMQKGGEEADPDALMAAIDDFVQTLQERDEAHVVGDVIDRIDMAAFTEVAEWTYAHVPYFLTDEDYARFDTLLTTPAFIPEQLARDKQMLMFPVSGLLSDNVQRDPLNWFTPVVAQLQGGQAAVNYENYEGYIFSPDMQRAFVMISSPYGASETERNAELVDFIGDCADAVMQSSPAIDIHVTGGPVIAVGNARQIKADSLLSVGIAVVLIVTLLLLVFRRWWHLMLIVLSIAWGWLFAMGALALIHDSISVIVIGISSVILGIAVNYPLHLIAHLQHTPDIRSALKEIVMPLVVGNITTVGAFLALVPLQSTALRDLGLFSALLLIGTILFVLLYLPHLVRENDELRITNDELREPDSSFFILHSSFLKKLPSLHFGDFSLEDKRWLVLLVVVLTFVFGYYSLQTSFDPNISHINYMTAEQKADMAYFQEVMAQNTTLRKVYVVSPDSTMDGALDHSRQRQPALRQLQAQGLVAQLQGCSRFLTSTAEQARRLQAWEAFTRRHAPAIEAAVRQAAAAEGFADDSFDAFFALLHTSFEPQPLSFFHPLASTVFASNLVADSAAREFQVVDVLETEDSLLQRVIDEVERADTTGYAFDIGGMNSLIATRLSDDFNYIGWACGLIVFFFLWLSLGSFELAALSFLPMAVSWLWILGIMALFGIQFNVVNVILATFIFGQGDDYTIFMTEGCQYEYTYGKKMLASYKNSILISAFIMFIGIGSLILARHPALHSLAEVTIVGMFSVVLMACLFPPLIYRWLIYKDGRLRRRPLTLRNLIHHSSFFILHSSFVIRHSSFFTLHSSFFTLHSSFLTRHSSFDSDPVAIVRDRYRYRTQDVLQPVRRRLRQTRNYAACMDSTALREAHTCIVWNCHEGELPQLLALAAPHLRVYAVAESDEMCTIARHAAEGIENITVLTKQEFKTYVMDNKEKIRNLLEEVLPLVDFDSDFLFSELDSLGITTILMTLADAYGIKLEAADATPKNLKTLDSIVAMVEEKLKH